MPKLPPNKSFLDEFLYEFRQTTSALDAFKLVASAVINTVLIIMTVVTIISISMQYLEGRMVAPSCTPDTSKEAQSAPK